MSFWRADNWREQSTGSMLSVLFFIFILLIGFQIGELDGAIRDRVHFVMRPALSALQGWRQIEKRGQLTLVLWKDGSGRLAQAEHELTVCQLQADQSQLLEQENKLLREALGRKDGPQQKAVRLYGSDSNWFIDAGLNQNINEGSIVTWQGSLVGRVTQANDRYSQVQTLLDREWKIPVKVGTASATGLFQQVRGYPEVVLLPRDAQLVEGDVVTTAGNEELVPDLPIGRVKNLEQENQGVTWRADVDPYFNYQQDFWVMVEMEKQP